MTKVKSFWRKHPIAIVASTVLLACLAGAGWVGASMFRLDPVTVDWDVPEAPELTAGPGQTLYRIDPSRSTATYEVEEILAGVGSTATGETQGIAGDILVDEDDPAASEVGDIVINVEQLTSDESLRDERLRQDYLDSDQYPLVTFATREVEGIPDAIEDGTAYDVTLLGDLTIKETTREVEVAGTVTRDDGELHVVADAHILLSDFDAGPISITGLVRSGDDADLHLDLVAPEADQLRIDEQGPDQVEYQVATAEDPQFSATVQPVLESSCASCHEPGGSGSGTWELATAGDAARVASGIGLAVESRYMPPWLASEEGVDLQHSPRLTDEEVAAITEWADAGGPLDVDPETRVEAAETDGPELRTDVELTLPEPYTGTVEKENDYRCFTLDPGLTEPAAVTGYQFLPDQLPIVHHALVYRVRGDSDEALAEAEARDDEPGWECFGGINVSGSGLSASGMGGSDLLMGWAPGQPPSLFPEGTGMKLEPGDKLVVQMHYHVDEDPPPDQSSLAMQMSDVDPDELDDIEVSTYLAPAEIPCLPEDQEAPRCDRDAEMEALREQYGPAGPIIANGLHAVCGTTPEEISHLDEDGIARTSCDHGVSSTGEVLAVLGHMHEIGSTFRMTLNPDTPEEQVLLDIPRWDFDWQFNYALDEDITLEEGDVIRVECSWDRALVDPTDEPHHISWAEGTEDEMCYSTLATRASG